MPALPVVIATLVLLAAGERSDGWAPRILSWPAFTGIGLMSYSIYLWHVPILAWVIDKLADRDFAMRLALYFPLCIVVGVVFGRLIEQPFLRLRDRVTTA